MLLEQRVESTGVGLLVHLIYDWLTRGLSALEEDHRGKHRDAVTVCQIGVLVDIHFNDDRPAIVLPRDFVDPR